MQRVAFLLRLQPGTEEAYEKAHQEVWPEMLALLKRSGISEYSIFRRDQMLFLTMHVEDFEQVWQRIEADPINTRWQQAMSAYFAPLDHAARSLLHAIGRSQWAIYLSIDSMATNLSLPQRAQRAIAAGYASAPALTFVAVLMAADLLLCSAGLVIDRRIITGAPAWLKPAKFAISTMIACGSFAFCILSTQVWRGLTRSLDVLLAVGFVIEIALIDMQAMRGTTSHFNVATRFDGLVFAVMGISIACIWLGMLLLTIVLFRQSFAGSAWGWSLRLGMVLALIGTGSGALMTLPTPAQSAAWHATGKMPIVGAHTVGAPDGARGIPITGWSAHHGDLRIAHFLGMHGLQVLPLLAWWSNRRGLAQAVQRKLIFTAAVSYVSLFALLLWQAFRGQSLLEPDRLSALSFAGWLLLTAVAVWAASRPKAIRFEKGMA
jgi:L-rhamnose mutarotase